MLLDIKDLKVHYGKINALKALSLTVEEGSIVALIGANGAGKTTLLNAISGVVYATSGSIRFQDREILNEKPQKIVIMGIAHVPEGRKIFPEFSVEQNLLAGAYTEKDKGKIKNLIEQNYELFPRLAERRKQEGGTLSGGEQQMLAIARGLMSDPDLLLLDEPSLGLAPILVEKIFEFIVEINKRGKSILLVEQNANIALQAANYGYVIETGKITIKDTAARLRNNDLVRKAYLGIA